MPASAAANTVAESLLTTLKQRGIDFVFANAGTDFAPIIEALVRLSSAGAPVPTFMTVPHENLAVAMAHGHYRAGGRAAAVMVHVTVGTANAVCALMNASRDRVPLLLMAGRTPLTQTGHAASRSLPIHWGQENFDQAGLVREYVKWEYELRAGQPVDELIGRALEVAGAEPSGPVYLTLPREVLAETAAGPPRAPTAKTVAAPQPGPAETARLARWLAAAERPVIVTSHVGRDIAAVERLGRLAETFAIPVAQSGPTCINLPASHSMNTGESGVELLERADLIVVLESDVPWFPRELTPAAGAKVAHLGVDPFCVRYPLRAYPADLVIPGAAGAALEALQAALGETPPPNAAIDARRASIGRYRERQAQRRAEAEAREAASKPIGYAHLAACLRDVMPADTLLVSELGLTADALALERPGSLIGVGTAGGLGFALGAALGAKLAAPERTVVATLGDGSYMFGNPTPFHFVAQAAGLPVLVIVCNNRRWQAVEDATLDVYPKGLAAATAPMPLVALEPTPEFSKVAEASGAFARRVEDPADLPTALGEAFDALRGGRQALLDVRTGRR